MAVTYNKINWDEETPITVANLDRIDVGIDEVVTQSNSNESRITTNEDDISNLETEQSNQDNRITTNENDISNIEDGTTDVANSLALQNESLEVVAEGTISINAVTVEEINLLNTGNDNVKYFYSVNQDGTRRVAQTYLDGSFDYCYIINSSTDVLAIKNNGTTTNDYIYKVWVLR